MSEICHAVGIVRTMSAACERGAAGSWDSQRRGRCSLDICWLKIHDRGLIEIGQGAFF